MALEGTLRDFSLADIFQLIGLQRKTGVLTLRGKEDTVTVTFLDGKVVAADSLNKRLENRLGYVLVKTGVLTPEKLTQALEIQRETLQRLGFILTHHAIISQDALRAALELQILQIVYRLFRWNDGDYQFSQETTIEYEKDNVRPISAESILMEGARMIDEWPIIEKRIRSFDMVFRHKPAGQEIEVVSSEDADDIDFDGTRSRKKKPAGEKIRISKGESSVYDLVDGTSSVAEIVERSQLPEFDTCKALYELLVRDIIEEIRERPAGATSDAGAEDLPLERPKRKAAAIALLLLFGILGLASLATSHRNPFTGVRPVGEPWSLITKAKKSVSLQRISTIGEAVDAFQLAEGRLPNRLQELVPTFVSANVLRDPWGRQYNYLQRGDKYIVTGSTIEGKTDADLFLSRTIDVAPIAAPAAQSGGIQLVD